MKHVGIDIKFYNLDTFNKQIDVNFIDLDTELVDLNYKVASLIFCHVWRSIHNTDLAQRESKQSCGFVISQASNQVEGNMFFFKKAPKQLEAELLQKMAAMRERGSSLHCDPEGI